MDILREFLESSTIHGLTYISTARVCLNTSFLIFTNPMSDEVSKDLMGSRRLPWVHRSWDPDQQVVQGVAGESHRHLDHHPPHRRPGLPQGDHLSSKELQHCPFP